MAKQFLPGSEGVWRESKEVGEREGMGEEGRGQGGEITQTLYEHVNK
jgi:hypothetical protein